MNLLSIVRAEAAVGELYKNTALCARESYGIMKLSKAMRDEAQFYHEKRNGLIAKYGTQDETDKSKYHLANAETMDAYLKALSELDATEVNIQYDRVKLRGDIPGVTPEMLDALDAFVEIID